MDSKAKEEIKVKNVDPNAVEFYAKDEVKEDLNAVESKAKEEVKEDSNKNTGLP